MCANELRAAIRKEARAYERTLGDAQRKRLGQFFTGVPLGALLAHLALEKGTRSVLDPMAGHGDLLDAALSAACERSIDLERLDGIEIDPATANACRRRLTQLVAASAAVDTSIVAGDAFDPGAITALRRNRYDLVITNPPYVRYQSPGKGTGSRAAVRSGLVAGLKTRCRGPGGAVWRALAEGYSGHSDLSVPSWIMAASMVKPGGRLAIVAPATWRTRNYGEVVRYLMLHCFALECVVEDQVPGWFSEALVRTHLIVARRLHECRDTPLDSSELASSLPWVQVSPKAAARGSLVGRAFIDACPDARFSSWLHTGCRDHVNGVRVRWLDLGRELEQVVERASSRRWFRKLDGKARHLPLLASGSGLSTSTLPNGLARALPEAFSQMTFISLKEAGIAVGQGLRTGCNDFFYVTACCSDGNRLVTVETSSLFDAARLPVPANALRPALRRQSELQNLEAGLVPEGRLLDLRQWILEVLPKVVDRRIDQAAFLT